MLEDAEAAPLHWAADTIDRTQPPVSKTVAAALKGLTEAIKGVKAADAADRTLIRKFIVYTMPDLLEPLRSRDALDLELLAAANAVARRGRDPEIGAATTWLLDTLIDDWRRHTGRSVTQAVGASSARGFIAAFLGLTRAFARDGDDSPVLAALARHKAALGSDLDKPLRKAIRGAATRK